MIDLDAYAAKYPAQMQVIKNRLSSNETLLAIAGAVSTPLPNLGWVPFVGSLLDLGRAASIKPFLLGVTDKRFLIIQVNRWAGVTKDVHEVSFQEVPIEQIRNCLAKTRFADGLVFGDSLKLELADGRKYDFRKISTEDAAMMREAIFNAQDELPAP